MTIKITSDGKPYGTKIVDDAGRDLTRFAQSLVWRHSAGELPTAEVTFALLHVDALASEYRWVGPNGKDVRRIEYADGTVEEFPGPAVPRDDEFIGRVAAFMAALKDRGPLTIKWGPKRRGKA